MRGGALRGGAIRGGAMRGGALTDTVFSFIPSLMLDSKLLRASGTAGVGAGACLRGGGGDHYLPSRGRGMRGRGQNTCMDNSH